MLHLKIPNKGRKKQGYCLQITIMSVINRDYYNKNKTIKSLSSVQQDFATKKNRFLIFLPIVFWNGNTKKIIFCIDYKINTGTFFS